MVETDEAYALVKETQDGCIAYIVAIYLDKITANVELEYNLMHYDRFYRVEKVSLYV